MTRFALSSLLSLLIASPCFANDVVSCDPSNSLVPNAVTRFQKVVDFPETPGFLVWIAPNNSMTAEKQAYMNQLRGQIDSLSGIPHRYWICTDTNPVDGILESVTEMTQAQKDAMDAPDLAESQRQQAFTDEIAGTTGNDICDASLAEIESRIDAKVASLQAQLDATSTNAQVKAHLRNDLYPALGLVFKRIGKCIRARAR